MLRGSAASRRPGGEDDVDAAGKEGVVSRRQPPEAARQSVNLQTGLAGDAGSSQTPALAAW